MAAGITVTLIHTGLSASSILLDDLRLEGDGSSGYRREGYYVPVGGTLELTFGGFVPISYERGDIFRFMQLGHITASFNYGGRAQRGTDGVVIVLAVAGAPAPDTYTGTVDDSLFLVDTTNDPVTLTLPTGATHLRGRFLVTDVGGNAGVNNIIITAAAGDTIGGGASYTLNTSNGQVEFVWDSAGNWFVPLGLGGAPTGPAGGDLAGNYPDPSVRALTTTTGPTQLIIGAVASGQVLQRVGATLVGVAPAGGTPVAAGATPYAAVAGQFIEVTTGAGAFVVNLPNPGVVGDRITIKKIDAGIGAITVDSNGGPNIDGAATYPAFAMQWRSVTVVRGTAQWLVE